MNKTKFLNPEQVLFRLGIDKSAKVVDLGAGSGHFATAASKMVGDNGKVYVVDILETALAHVSAQARLLNAKNIQTIQADLEKDSLSKIEDGSVDLVLIVNILHQVRNSKNIFSESYRMLKTGGKVIVIDWSMTPGPIGPKADLRISDDEIKTSAAKLGFKFASEIDTDAYHFGLIFNK